MTSMVKVFAIVLLLSACGDNQRTLPDAAPTADADPRPVVEWTCVLDATCAGSFADEWRGVQRGTNEGDVESLLAENCLESPRMIACHEFRDCYAYCQPKGPPNDAP